LARQLAAAQRRPDELSNKGDKEMSNRNVRLLATMPLVISLAGCAIGYNTALFTTKSNFGVNIDSTPKPTAEVSLSRLEAALAPAFEYGQTPPLMASYHVNSGLALPMFGKVSSTFEGGDAAMAMAKLFGSHEVGTNQYDSALWLTQPPTNNNCSLLNLPGPGEIRPFIYGTDTTIGFKLAWSGVGGPYPDSLKLGVHRKELACAPVFGRSQTNVVTNQHGNVVTNTYSVKMPSFIATMDLNVGAAAREAGGTSNKFSCLQYIATGEAATQLALQPSVRETLAVRLDPVAASKVKEYRNHADLQTKAVERITAIFGKMTDSQKEKTLAIAIALGLVNEGTTGDSFRSQLTDRIKGAKPEVTRKMRTLEDYLHDPQ
jgi:hypothetical protein